MIRIPAPTAKGLWPAVALFPAVTALLVSPHLLLGASPLSLCLLALLSAAATLLIWPWRGTQPGLAAIVIGVYFHPLAALCFANPRKDTPLHWAIDLLHASLDMGLMGGFPLVIGNYFAFQYLTKRQ